MNKTVKNRKLFVMNNVNILLNKIAVLCKEKHYSLVTAESCTGGGLAYAITKNLQSSSILERGYITYSINSKEDVLKISTYTLQIYGTVSKETSIEMAKKALKKSKAQISVAITGLDHETIKNEGLNESGIAWISCSAIFKDTIYKKFYLKGSRKYCCEQLILHALEMLHNYIK